MYSEKNRNIGNGKMPWVISNIQNDFLFEFVQLLDKLKQRNRLFLFR